MAKNSKRLCPACNKVKLFRVDQKTCGCKGTNPSKVDKPVEVESDERKADERVVKKAVSKPVKTLADLAKVCEIDLSIWEVERWKCGAWQTGMKAKDKDEAFYSEQYVVMAWLRLKKHVVAATSEIEELRKKAAVHVAPTYTLPVVPRNSSTLCEFSIFDHHFGALAWGKETGWADYDSGIAKQGYEAALSTLVARTAEHKLDRVLLILGNDQQNIDNRVGTTEKGTPQTSDSRYQKIFGISRDVSIWAIDTLASVAPNVDVIMVPGNHDQLATWHLGDSLQAWFRQFPNISIDNSPLFRKYYQYGVNMLMFTHGNKGKLEQYDTTMAAERPDMWGGTLWREAHTGDKHHRRLIELQGATVRILPSLRPPDSWTSENHFVGALRAAEAYVWHKQEGLVGTAVYSILGDKTA